jgi:hypothetical protein
MAEIGFFIEKGVRGQKVTHWVGMFQLLIITMTIHKESFSMITPRLVQL